MNPTTGPAIGAGTRAERRHRDAPAFARDRRALGR